jgi:hypothetical protein
VLDAFALQEKRAVAMKNRAFVIVMLVMLLTLLLAGPAQAGATRTPVTGAMWIVGEIWEGRYWVPGPHFVFWRGTTFFQQVEMDDARVTGILCALHNGNYTPSPDPIGFVEGQMWAKIWMYPPMAPENIVCGEGDFLWEGSMVGDRAADGSEHTKMVLKGRGVYEGLQLRLEGWLAPGVDVVSLAGEVLDPGK